MNANNQNRNCFERLPEILLPKEAAEFLRISLRAVWRLLASGELQAVKVGRLTRIEKSALLDYLEQHRKGGVS